MSFSSGAMVLSQKNRLCLLNCLFGVWNAYFVEKCPLGALVWFSVFKELLHIKILVCGMHCGEKCLDFSSGALVWLLTCQNLSTL